jgi:curved DNA-binding protein CbpA
MKTLYEILGIRRTATPEQIAKAYRKLAVKYHPDVVKGDPAAATKKFHEMQEAYDVLSDPERRKLYDETGSTVPPGRKQDAVMLSLLDLQRRVMEAAASALSGIDVFEIMRKEIKRALAGHLDAQRQHEKRAHCFRLAAGRMLPEAENPFREAALNFAHQAEDEAKESERRFGLCRDSLAALERFSMRQEPETGSMFRPSLQWNWARNWQHV